MRMRIIQFCNNFYNIVDTKDCPPLGDYCVFGHFDALTILHPRLVLQSNTNGQQSIDIWKSSTNTLMDSLDIHCSKRNLFCFTDDKKKDDEFNALREKSPILMVSLLRINGKYCRENFNDDVSLFVSQKNMMFYYTNTHSEVVVLVCGTSYIDCKRLVLELRDKLNVLKMYTAFAVKENSLKNDSVKNEDVDCRFRMMVRDNKKAERFLTNLESCLNVQGSRRFDVLGDCDVLVEYSDVSLHKLLPLYEMGSMMTHPYYKDTFYNIETEIVS